MISILRWHEIGNSITVSLPHGIGPHTTDYRSITMLQGSSVDTSADITAVSRIEDLTLCFASYGEGNTQDYIGDWSGLETLLNSLKFLKSLKLRLPCSVGDDELANVYLRQYQVLPQPKTWERLESLMLWGMAARATEVCSLLLTKMPVLRDLSIASIELLTGTWEGVIERLRQEGELSSFEIDGMEGLEFLHRQKQEFPSLGEQIPEIEDYVFNGGRHPYLKSGEPSSTSAKFLKTMDDHLEPDSEVEDDSEDESMDDWEDTDDELPHSPSEFSGDIMDVEEILGYS